jgi:hypothetical protein
MMRKSRINQPPAIKNDMGSMGILQIVFGATVKLKCVAGFVQKTFARHLPGKSFIAPFHQGDCTR